MWWGFAGVRLGFWFSADQGYKKTDPAGKESRSEFDDVGRVTKQIDNYTDGTRPRAAAMKT